MTTAPADVVEAALAGRKELALIAERSVAAVGRCSPLAAATRPIPEVAARGDRDARDARLLLLALLGTGR